MLQLTLGQSDEKIVVTLTELQTLTNPYFLFRFKHVTTKEIVSVIYASADDESSYPYRFNQFSIDTSVKFNNKPPGEWHYKVYEQTSAVNTDPALATTLLEYGKLMLLPAIEFAAEMYDNSPPTFKAYQG